MKERSGAVVALKELPEAKSRLSPLAPAVRRRLAELMVVTVARALVEAVDELVIVTPAPGVPALLAAHGIRATCLADPGGGLNPALLAGAEELLARECGLVLACMGDLPALTDADITTALTGCTGQGRWFVRDAAGTGTTLLVARGQPLNPAFGADSALRHGRSGAAELAAARSLRRDVDDAADLIAAARLGLQPPVSALIDTDGRSGHDTAVVAGPASAGWRLITSGGSRVLASRSAVGADVRSLATGQRVHVACAEDGSVRHVWL